MPSQIDRFMTVYQPELRNAVLSYPNEYGFSVDLVPTVCERMRAAIIRGSFNKDGRAMKATFKALGIKYTYTAISAWLKE